MWKIAQIFVQILYFVEKSQESFSGTLCDLSSMKKMSVQITNRVKRLGIAVFLTQRY